MKLQPTFLAVLVAMAAVTAPAATLPFPSGNLGYSIPDGNPAGVSHSISTATFAGQNIQGVTVNINVAGGFNGDIYAYLSYNNSSVVLLNRVGRTSGDAFGYNNSGFSITFNDTLSGGNSVYNDIHNYQNHSPGYNGSGALLGTWATDRRTDNSLAVTDVSTRGNSLLHFNGMDAGGTWTIFFADMAGGGGSTALSLTDWSLTVTVPEPTHVALGIFGVAFVGVAVGRRLYAQAQARAAQ